MPKAIDVFDRNSKLVWTPFITVLNWFVERILKQKEEKFLGKRQISSRQNLPLFFRGSGLFLHSQETSLIALKTNWQLPAKILQCFGNPAECATLAAAFCNLQFCASSYDDSILETS